MTPVALGLLAGLGLLGTWVVTRSTGPSFPEPSKAARFSGYLQKGQIYRVWGQVDRGYTEKFRASRPGKDQQVALSDDLKVWLSKAGFDPILLAAQDPSVSDIWTFVARWALNSQEAFDQGPLKLYQLQAVDEPPVKMIPPIDPPLKLDPGLLIDELESIKYALARDEEPKHLTGFASVLVPEFPIAGSILRAKASLIEAERLGGGMMISGLEDKRVQERYAYEAATTVVGFLDAFDWFADKAEDVVDALKDITEDLGKTVQDMWDKYGGVVEVLGGWIPGPQIWAIETAYKIADAINKGQNVGDAIPEKLSEQGARFAKGMQATSPFVAMIPGLGTGVAMMMNASAALALAQPLDEAALDTISLVVPGGPLAQQGFRTAANFGSGMLRGEEWDDAAVNAARKTFKDQVGEEAAIAFDAGLALARGKSLQEAGFGALYQLTKGNDLADRAAHFAEALVIAKQQGKSVKSVLVEQLSSALDKYGRTEAVKKVTEVVDYIQKDGNLLKMTPKELADRLGIAEEIATAAQGAVKEIADGIRIVDWEVMRVINPFVTSTSTSNLLTSTQAKSILTIAPIRADTSKTFRDAWSLPEPIVTAQVSTTISPTALKIVEATKRPEQSLVADPAKVMERIGEVNRAAANGDPEALRAKEALARASRELERRRWVSYYMRQMELEPL